MSSIGMTPLRNMALLPNLFLLKQDNCKGEKKNDGARNSFIAATLINDAEELVRLGAFHSRSDVIRSGLRDIIEKNHWRLEKKSEVKTL